MGKSSIVMYIVAAVLTLFFLSSYSPKKPLIHRHRRLKLRSNFTLVSSHRPSLHHDPVAFDPIVAEIERRREQRQFAAGAQPPESQPEWENFMDAEDYLNDVEKFNVTSRLVLLFPKIDVDPADGFVSEHELTEWNLQQTEREVLLRTMREMEIHDKNHDGFVSFSEYQPPSWVHNSGSISNCFVFVFLFGI